MLFMPFHAFQQRAFFQTLSGLAFGSQAVAPAVFQLSVEALKAALCSLVLLGRSQPLGFGCDARWVCLPVCGHMIKREANRKPT